MKFQNNRIAWVLAYISVAVLVIFIVTVCWAFFEQRTAISEREARRAELQVELNRIAEKIQDSIARNSDALRSLSTFVELEPDMSRAQFEAYSRRSFLRLPEFKVVAMAPDLIISNVFPLEGNNAVIGMDYRTIPEQYAAIQKSIAEDEVIMAGPVDLIQGDQGLIARKAVWTSDFGAFRPRLWGIVSLVLDLDVILQNAGALDVPFELAIRGKDGYGPVGGMIFGNSSLFGKNAVTAPVSLPQGSWWMAAMPKDGWAVPASHFQQLRLTFLFIGLLLVAIALGGMRLMQLRMRAVAQLTNAINSIDDGFAFYDADERLIVCNDKYRELYTLSADLLVPGTKFDDIIRAGVARGQYPDAIGNEEIWIAERLRAHRAADSVVEQRLDDGRWLKIAEAKTPDGGTVGFRVDITELKNAKEAAERANLAKSEFLDVMSHELRTPLTVVLGGTPFLCKPELLPAATKLYATLDAHGEAGDAVRDDVDALLGSLKTLAGKVERSAKHLLTLINDVLDFSKIEAGRMDVDFKNIEAHGVVADLLDDFEQKASEKGLVLVNEVAPQLIRADEVRLRQVLINIIGNALKFTDEGSVRVSSQEVNGFIRLSVTDTGCGIPEDRVQTVFEKFTQVDSSSKRKAGGTGLGMAISKRIVEMHGGEITVSSAVGQGSTFSFTMRKAQPENESPDPGDASTSTIAA